MPGFDDAALDAQLQGQPGAENLIVFQLGAEFEADLRQVLENTRWYALNMRYRPDTCANTKLRIVEEARRACQRYAGQLWLAGGIVLEEGEIVWIVKWCFRLRNSLDASPRLDLKTSFLHDCGDRLKRALQTQRGVEVALDVCVDFVKRVWAKATGHRAAADGEKHVGTKRLREEELSESKACLYQLENTHTPPAQANAASANAQHQQVGGPCIEGEDEKPAARGGRAGGCAGRGGARGRGGRASGP